MDKRVVEALCVNYGYEEMIDDKPNEESPEDFAQRMVDGFLADHVKAYELKIVKTRVEEDYAKDPETTLATAKRAEPIEIIK